MALTPKDAAKDAEFVFACVGADDDVRAMTIGADGAFRHGSRRDLYYNTTASAEVARELYAKAKDMGLGFIDAPVSRRSSGAENGILTVMCGGDADVFGQAEPVIRAYGKTVTHIGGAGAGQQAKMVNQICIAGLVQGLSKALNFGQRAGLIWRRCWIRSLAGRRKAGRWSTVGGPW